MKGHGILNGLLQCNELCVWVLPQIRPVSGLS